MREAVQFDFFHPTPCTGGVHAELQVGKVVEADEHAEDVDAAFLCELAKLEHDIVRVAADREGVIPVTPPTRGLDFATARDGLLRVTFAS